MAQKVEVLLVDDLDGGKADETVHFSLDGTDYEIDLSVANGDELRAVLEPYAEKARKAVRGGARRGRPARTVTDRERTAEIRAWARQNGSHVNDRGRIPREIIEQYEAANPGR
ncbi:histone-like nucleoid-structuring protein Lsr2 [Actinomadura rupiterrae]|uniref:histone-like nucleoid-structuring protein Lsr2 n=1 Tax=Actinomadura rupiterrae TaxID=559627 RepID=UPI0020A52C42|nr:Lsr2 family protein [Actinomadura rupiterrae]MCP2341424.1 hypothetical protein [Actinomadura rupiterrae]